MSETNRFSGFVQNPALTNCPFSGLPSSQCQGCGCKEKTYTEEEVKKLTYCAWRSGYSDNVNGRLTNLKYFRRWWNQNKKK